MHCHRSILAAAWWISINQLDWWGYLSLSIVAGIISGLGINTGHELGHKKSKFEKTLAKLVLAVPFYGHFTIDHNQGHHRDVATPIDGSSSRMGENFYSFCMQGNSSCHCQSMSKLENHKITAKKSRFSVF